MLFLLLLILPEVRTQEPSAASVTTRPYRLPFNAVQFIPHSQSKKGPILFPNDAPPPPPTPLIVTSRPLSESIARSELNPNNSIAAQSQYHQVTFRPEYLAREKNYKPFIYAVATATPVYDYKGSKLVYDTAREVQERHKENFYKDYEREQNQKSIFNGKATSRQPKVWHSSLGSIQKHPNSDIKARKGLYTHNNEGKGLDEDHEKLVSTNKNGVRINYGNIKQESRHQGIKDLKIRPLMSINKFNTNNSDKEGTGPHNRNEGDIKDFHQRATNNVDNLSRENKGYTVMRPIFSSKSNENHNNVHSIDENAVKVRPIKDTELMKGFQRSNARHIMLKRAHDNDQRTSETLVNKDDLSEDENFVIQKRPLRNLKELTDNIYYPSERNVITRTLRTYNQIEDNKENLSNFVNSKSSSKYHKANLYYLSNSYEEMQKTTKYAGASKTNAVVWKQIASKKPAYNWNSQHRTQRTTNHADVYGRNYNRQERTFQKPLHFSDYSKEMPVMELDEIKKPEQYLPANLDTLEALNPTDTRKNWKLPDDSIRDTNFKHRAIKPLRLVKRSRLQNKKTLQYIPETSTQSSEYLSNDLVLTKDNFGKELQQRPYSWDDREDIQQHSLKPYYDVNAVQRPQNLVAKVESTKYQDYPERYHYTTNEANKENSKEYNNHGENYAFSYAVKDQKTGDDFSHSQHSTGSATNGEYRVRLPDGRMQIVKYTADENGYKADVRYDDHHNDNSIDYNDQGHNDKRFRNDIVPVTVKNYHVDSLENYDHLRHRYNSNKIQTGFPERPTYIKNPTVNTNYAQVNPTTNFDSTAFDNQNQNFNYNGYKTKTTYIDPTQAAILDHTIDISNNNNEYLDNYDRTVNIDNGETAKDLDYTNDNLNSKEIVDYSSELDQGYQPHKSKYSVFSNPNAVSTVRPSYEELKDIFLTNARRNSVGPVAVVTTPRPEYSVTPVNVVEITPKKSNLYTNIKSIVTGSPLSFTTPSPSTPRGYLLSTIANLREQINLSNKPVLSNHFINKINKYLTYK